MKRKISAILAADVAGYSRLVAEDEEETIRRLAAYREVFDEFVTRCGGRIFNTAGDAVLAEFPSAVDAVRCAIDVQESFRTRNLAYPPARHMAFRIGITIGDVIEREGDLLGDGVNIAARLEGLAAPGGICVSGFLYEQVRNKISVKFEDIGEQHVKNIPNAIHAYVIAVEGAPSGRGVLRRAARYRKTWLIAGAAFSAAVVTVSVLIVRLPDFVAPRSRATSTAEPSPAALERSKTAGEASLGSVPGPFDGLWEVSMTGNEHCVYRSADFRIAVTNGVVVRSTRDSGKVEPSGDFRFTSPSRANPNLTIRYTGRLSGDAGEGSYQVLGSMCGGTLALKRFN